MAKCVGCGYCCMKAVCVVGQFFHPDAKNGKCPELYWDEGKSMYRCKCSNFGEKITSELYFGLGCSSSLNTWRRNVRPRANILDNNPP